MDKKSAVSSPITSLLPRLESWEDFLSAFFKLTEYEQKSIWYRADLLTQMADKFGSEHIKQFAADVGMPYLTIYTWVRTARAFPEDRRDTTLPFTTHVYAGFTDNYNDVEGKFSGTERFGWIQKAANELLPAREIRRQIEQKKRQQELVGEFGISTIRCSYCNKNNSDGMETYSISCASRRGNVGKFDMHYECFLQFTKGLNLITPLKELTSGDEKEGRSDTVDRTSNN